MEVKAIFVVLKFNNLIINAIEHSRRSGKVEISLESLARLFKLDLFATNQLIVRFLCVNVW
jgi:signal transduction histidine kinase